MSDQLRKWAEAAGLHVTTEHAEHEPSGWSAATPAQGGMRYRYGGSNPALLPLIAERLVERVREMGDDTLIWEMGAKHVDALRDLSPTLIIAKAMAATAAQRAEAAYKVLEES